MYAFLTLYLLWGLKFKYVEGKIGVLVQHSLVVRLVHSADPADSVASVYIASVLGLLLVCYGVLHDLAGAVVSWIKVYSWVQALGTCLDVEAYFASSPHCHLHKLWTALESSTVMVDIEVGWVCKMYSSVQPCSARPINPFADSAIWNVQG